MEMEEEDLYGMWATEQRCLAIANFQRGSEYREGREQGRDQKSISQG
jgi:hypothetical protein